MNQRIEIITKDITRPRLTVATDRITIKLPLVCENKEKFIELFLKVGEKLKDTKVTLRGKIMHDHIMMFNEIKKLVYKEKVEEL